MGIDSAQDRLPPDQFNDEKGKGARDEAEGVFDHASETVHADLSKCRIERKADRRGEDNQQTGFPAAAEKRSGFCDGDQACNSQKQSDCLLTIEQIVDDEMRKDHSKDRIRRHDNRGRTGAAHLDADLEKDHADADVDHTEREEIKKIIPVKFQFPPADLPEGEGQEHEASDHEAEEGQLKRHEGAGCDFQGDLHRPEGKGCDQDA